MTVRISENQLARTVLNDALKNRLSIAKYSKELSSGYAVGEAGDSRFSGTIAQLRETLGKVSGYKQRANSVQGFLGAQDGALGQAGDILIRAQEIATQGANETNGPAERALLAQEVWEIRNHMINLANTTYQGRFVFSGTSDGTPAYSLDNANPFTDPATGPASEFYVYDSATGASQTRSVKVAEDVTVTVNTPGNSVFGNAIAALTQLGRSLEGYRTAYQGDGTPDNAASTAFDLPTELNLQTDEILVALDSLKTSRSDDVIAERTNLAGRMRRIETAQSLLELSEQSAQEVLSGMQDADLTISSSNLATAQTALQAALTVTGQVLRQSILQYL